MKSDLLNRILGTSVDVTKSELFVALQEEYTGFKTEATALIEAQSAQLADLTKAKEASDALVAELSAKVQRAEDEKATTEAAAEVARLAARKSKVEAALGTDKAGALLTATEGMSDTQFDAVVSALGVKAEQEAKSPLFNEVGVTAEVDASAAVVSPIKRLITEKYGTA